MDKEHDGILFDVPMGDTRTLITDEPAVSGMTDEEWDTWWNGRKKDNHNHNMQFLDKKFYKGRFFRNGQGQ